MCPEMVQGRIGQVRMSPTLATALVLPIPVAFVFVVLFWNDHLARHAEVGAILDWIRKPHVDQLLGYVGAGSVSGGWLPGVTPPVDCVCIITHPDGHSSDPTPVGHYRCVFLRARKLEE